jgi:filamentous hemagglutinin
MNKHLHRIIFNATRGMRMVVQETASSAGKATGATAGSGSPGVDNNRREFAGLDAIALAVLCLVSAPLQLMSEAQAQVVADPTAPHHQQPTVLGTANGLPLVNIQTPSAAGVSRNTYSQFDVNRPGVVLNNSRTNVQTQLGGWVPGNPWLATGSARVILNEVNSSSPSQLRGFVEVAGPRAEVIIANPAGVNIDGAGFINASRATITTGTAIVSGGSLDGFVVQRGLVSINGAGLDARQTDYTSILARAVEVNGQVAANELKVVTGANQIDAAQTSVAPVAGTGAAPAFALDASALGGMYAGKITLIGTEAGVGVRNAGAIGASAGNLVLQTNGWLSNSGSLRASGDAVITAQGAVTNAGSVFVNGQATVTAAGAIVNEGLLAAQGDIQLRTDGLDGQIASGRSSVIAAGLNPDGTTSTTGNLTIHSSAATALNGQMVAGGNIDLSATQLDLSGGKVSSQNLSLTARTGDVNASQARISTAGTLAVHAAQTLRTDGAVVSAQKLDLQARALSNVAGELVQTGRADLAIQLTSPDGTLDNTRGRIAANSDNLSLAAGTLINTEGRIEHAGTGTLAINALTFEGQRGHIEGNGALRLSADSIDHQAAHTQAQQISIGARLLDNRQGDIAQSGSALATFVAADVIDNRGGSLTTNGTGQINARAIDNTGGRITAMQSASVTASASLNNTEGTLASTQQLSVATGHLNNTRGTVQASSGNASLTVDEFSNETGSVYAGGHLSTTAVNVSNSGSLYAAGNQTLNASGTVSNSGVIAAQGQTTITASSLSSASGSLLGAGVKADGTLASSGDLSVTTSQGMIANGQNLAAGNAVLSGASVDVSASQSSAANLTLAAASGNVTTALARVTTPGTLRISAQAQDGQVLDNRQGTLSAGQLELQVANLNNRQGGQIIQSGTGDTRIVLSSPTASLDNSGGRIAVNSANLSLGATTLNNTDGVIEHAGTGSLRLSAADLNDARGQITTNGGLAISADTLDHRSASTVARQLSIQSRVLQNQGGRLVQTGNGQTTIAASARMDNSAGEVASNGDLSLSTARLTNNGGRITSGQNVNVAASASVDNSAGVIAAQHHLDLSSAQLSNRVGSLQAVDGNVSLTVAEFSNDAGSVYAGGHLSTTAVNVSNSGSLYAAGNQSLNASGAVSNSGVIAAQGSTTLNASSLSSAASSLLGAGVKADGSLAPAGDLTVTTRQALSAHGQNLAASHAMLSGASLDISASQSSASNITLAATSGNVTTAQARVVTPGTLRISAQAQDGQVLDNRQGTLSAGQLDLQVANLNNSQGGQIIQSGMGDTRIVLSSPTASLDNSGGRIAVNSANLALGAARLNNTDGVIEHAGTGSLTLTAADLNDQRGQITTNGRLAIAAVAINHDGASTSARNVSMATGTLSNRSGEIIQTGAQASSIVATGQLDNRAGRVVSNGGLDVSAQSLDNQGGTLQATGTAGLSVTTIAALDNRASGQLAAGGDLRLMAGTLNNAQGAVTAGGSLRGTVAADIQNNGGLVAANGALSLSAGTLSNSGGTVASVHDSLSITTSSTTDNNSGKIQAALDVTLSNQGLSNSRDGAAIEAGQVVSGRNLVIQAQGQALDNRGGTLAGTQSVSLSSGALNNDAGRIEAGAALRIDTNGQALTNTRASAHRTGAGGISARGTVDLSSADLINTQGFLGATGAMTARTAQVVNTQGGQIVGQSSISLTATAVDNQGGQIQALGNVGIEVGAGTINNSASLIRSADTLTLTAASVINNATQGVQQGIEAKDVTITAGLVSNRLGAIRGDNNVALNSQGSIDNTSGLVSAGNTLSLQDSATAPTLAITNSGGTLIGGQNTVIRASSLTGDGRVLSRGDLAISLGQDFNNAAGGEVVANQNASISTSGNLSNDGKLQAGNTLSINAQNISNAATGEMSGAVTQVTAAGTLTNRGLIDGQETRITTTTLNNVGTGRLYGDRVSIAAVTVNNDGEAGRAGTVAARDRLDVGAQTLNNRDGALVFSLNEMALGGSLDANRRAIGSAQTLNNNGSTIEALGNLSASASQINNINTNFAYSVRLDSSAAVKEYVTGFGTFSGADVAWEVGAETFQAAGHGGYLYATGKGRIVLAGAPYADRAFQPYYSGGDAYTPPSFETVGSGDNTTSVPVPGRFAYTPDSPVWQVFSVAPPTAAAPGPRPAGTYLNNENADFIPPTASEIAAWEAAAAPWLALQSKIDSMRASVDASALLFDGFRSYTATVPVPTITQSTPARLLSGGSMTLNAATALLNDQSQIVSGGVLSITGQAVDNRARVISVDAQRNGTAYAWRNYNEGCGNFFGCDYNYNAYGDSPYVQSVPQSVTLNIGNVQSFASPASQGLGSGAQPGTRANASTSEGVSPVTQASVANLVATASTNNVALGSIAQAGSQAAATAIGINSASSSTFSATAVNPSLGAGTGGTALAPVTGISATPQLIAIADAATISPPPATSGVQTVRLAAVNTTVPRSSLFGINPSPEARYLVETDPRFANYRQWLGSDYFLGALAIDPATVQKRLGDGFYEQRLISEQVAQLTGQRFLANYSSDEQEYRALMDAGITYAKTYNLRPGLALSAAQMAQLTADIVWLVEQEVTLADGSRQKALVPQVYVRVKEGDLAPSGALLAGSSVNLNLSGDLTNSGTISGNAAGRSIVSITADNIQNLGGRISGDTVSMMAKGDLNNIGGQISAGSALMAIAGRDIFIETTTSSATNRVSSNGSHNTFSQTGIDRVAGLYVTNPGGTLVASAGRDLNILGGVVANGSTGTGAVTTPQATTVLAAKRDLNLGVVTTSNSSDLTRDAQNYLRDAQSQDIGTQIRTAGNVVLQAGQDLNAKAATVQAAGSLTASAGNNVNLTAGQTQSSFGFGLTSNETKLFSSTSTTERRSSEQTQAVGSSLSGNTVTVAAGNDIRVTGSRVASEQATTLTARNNLIIEAAQNTAASASFLEKKESGLMFNGSLSNPNSLGIDLKRGASSDATQSSLTQAGSSITSANGPTSLMAQNGVLAVIASNVSAGADKQLTLQGAQVLLSGGLNSQQSTLEQTREATNIHAGIVKPSEGIFSRGGAKEAHGQTTLAATTLSGGNINVTATGQLGQNSDGTPTPSGLTLAGVKVTTPGTLSLDAGEGKLALNLIQTTTSASEETRQRDLAYQKAQGAGATSTEAQYNELSYGKLTVKGPAITIEQAQSAGSHGAAIPKTLAELASQPGLTWIADMQRQQAENARTNPAAALHIENVKLAHEQWDYKQQGLTKEGAVIVAVVVAYFTAGAASGVGVTAGEAAAVGAGEGVALAGGGTVLTGTGAVISTVVGGAVTAGLTTLATQASISLINNQGDLGATLKDLGSKESVKALVTAVVTGGVLAGMNFSPTGQPTVDGGAQTFTNQLGQNLKAGIARTLVSTAINGGSLEDNLKGAITTAFIDTAAAQGANWIGDMQQAGTLDAFTHKLAHALAGCAAGAARAGTNGCAPGAIGAVIGEISAEAYGKKSDTVEFAAMVSGIGAALAGGDAAQISLASSAGANAAANNYLKHPDASRLLALQKKQNAGTLTAQERQERDALIQKDATTSAQLNGCAYSTSPACQSVKADFVQAQQSFLPSQVEIQQWASDKAASSPYTAAQLTDAYNFAFTKGAQPPAQTSAGDLSGAYDWIVKDLSDSAKASGASVLDKIYMGWATANAPSVAGGVTAAIISGQALLTSGVKVSTLPAFNKPPAPTVEEVAAAAKARIEQNARVSDAQQYDKFRSTTKNDWDWQGQAPNGGAIPGSATTNTINRGDTLDRFGSRRGEYLSPANTPFEQRGLPPGRQAEPYEQYPVLKPFTVVQEKIAPAFDQPAGGVQMRATIPEVKNRFANINDLITFGYLKDPKANP